MKKCKLKQIKFAVIFIENNEKNILDIEKNHVLNTWIFPNLRAY